MTLNPDSQMVSAKFPSLRLACVSAALLTTVVANTLSAGSVGQMVALSLTNHPPTDILLSAAVVPDNWPAGAAIGKFSASDPDEGDTHTFALVEGEGDDGNPFFAIAGDTLMTVAVFDLEVQSSYTIRVRTTDTIGLSFEKVFTLTVEPVHRGPAPGELDLSFATGAVNDTVNAVARQPDGKWIIAGRLTAVHGQSIARIARLNADGTLDTSFLDGLSGTNGTIFAVAVQEDGKILIGGNFTTVNGTQQGRLARLHPNGALDTTFSSGVAGTDYGVRAICVQEDGQILIGGIFTTIHGQPRNRIARLNTDGSLDDDFSPQVGASGGYVNVIVCQADGQIVIGGSFSQIDETSRTNLARLNADGSLDLAFAPEITGYHIRAIALQPDGRILISGWFTAVNGTPRNHIARLNADGATDLTFGEEMTGLNNQALALALMPDNRIVAAGHFTSVNGITRNRIARLHADGSLDHTFAVNASGPNFIVNDVALQHDDETILIGGDFTTVNDQPHQRVALLHNNELAPNQPPTDISLSSNWILDDAPIGSTIGLLTAADPDLDDAHNFLLVPGEGDSGNGSFTIEDNQLKTAVHFDHTTQSNYSVRIQATDTAGLFVKKNFAITIARTPGELPGDLDLTFDPDAIDDPVNAIARQSDGKWIVGGNVASIGDHPRGRIARLNADGTLDRSFGMAEANSLVTAVAVQQDGKVIVVGYFTSMNGQPRARIARLHQDGSLDEAFVVQNTSRGGTHAVTVQTDGRILVGGSAMTVNGQQVIGVARLNPDGSFDEEFASQLAAYWDVRDVSVLENGKILVAGVSPQTTGGYRGAVTRLHPDGTLDETFTTTFTPSSWPIHSMAIQPDGRIVIGGRLLHIVGGQVQYGIARLHPDGLFDTSFGYGQTGVAGGSPAQVNSVAAMPNGKILIGGDFTTVNDKPRNRIARLNKDGTLDESFGAGLTGANNVVYAVAAHGLDILIGGAFTTINALPHRHLAMLKGGNLAPTDILLSSHNVRENRAIGSIVGRLTAVDPNEDDHHFFSLIEGEGDDGNAFFAIEGNRLKITAPLDREEGPTRTIRIRATDFSDSAVEKILTIDVTPAPVPLPFPGDVDLSFAPGLSINGTVRTILEQTDGKIVIGGEFTSVNGQPRNRIARLHPDGTLDETFAPNLSGANGSVMSLAQRRDGRILLGGHFTSIHGVGRPFVARLNADGTLDPSFGSLQGGLNAPVLSLALQDDGKVVVGGTFTAFNHTMRNRIARLDANGDLDTSFGHEMSGANSVVEAITLDDAGNVIIGGRFTNVNGSPRGRVARILPDGALDTGFGNDLAGANAPVFALAVQEDGGILVGGDFSSINGSARNLVSRLHSDGSNDPAFSPPNFGPVRSIAIQQDGRAILGGGGGITRILPNGPRDSSFHPGVPGVNNWIHSVALQHGGGIFVAGAFTSLNGIPQSHLARLEGGDPAPLSIQLNKLSVLERQPTGAFVGKLSAYDLITTETHTFTLVDDEGNDFFTIEGDTLRTATEFDANDRDTYTVRIRATNTQGLWLKRTFTITVEANPFAYWAEALPENERAPTDDPGGFGIANFLRYAFALDPQQPDRTRLPQIGERSISEGEQPGVYLTFTYTRRTDDSSLNYLAEASDDLLVWHPFAGSEAISDDGNGETETVTLTNAQPINQQARQFLRVRIER